MVTFSQLWANHPYPNSPCDTTAFPNQCAIRMSVALELSGVDTRSFDAMYPRRRCWHRHSPGHILSAQELADWLATQSGFGNLRRYPRATVEDFRGRSGIVFIQNGWGSTDHIDLWDGSSMRGGYASYFSRGPVWFWSL